MSAFGRIASWFQTKVSKVSSVIAVSTFGGVVWPDAKYEVYATETYLRNIIAFKCIKMIADACSSIPWKLYTTDEEGERDEVKDNPILRLTKRTSPEDSWQFFIARTISFLIMSGNAYLEKVCTETGDNKGIPQELYSLRPDRVNIKVNSITGKIIKYIYTVNSKPVEWEVNDDGTCDILHLKLFHPMDDWYGAAITQTARYEIDTSNAETEHNKKLLDNECRPGMVFSYKGNLTDQQFDRLEKQLKDKFSGPQNAGKNLILEGEDKPDVRPYGFSPAEMDFIEGGREKARRIALAYGVPSMLLGIPGDNTFSNYKEARLAFWEDTILPLMTFLKGEFNNWFFGMENVNGLELDYILDEIPALAPKREALWDKLNSASWLTINEKRKLSGHDEIDSGDVILVSATMMPLDTISTPIEEEEESVQVEDEEAIQKLMAKGYNKLEAEEMIGRSAPKDGGNGKS